VRRRSIQYKKNNNSNTSMPTEIRHHHEGFGFGFGVGVGVGVVTGPTTGEYVGDGLGFSVLGDGLGDGLGEGVVMGGFGDGVGGYPCGSSANTAIALSNNRITTLSQTSHLWVECAFMEVSPVFINGFVSRTFVST
jgi:hypothetical protein